MVTRRRRMHVVHDRSAGVFAHALALTMVVAVVLAVFSAAAAPRVRLARASSGIGAAGEVSFSHDGRLAVSGEPAPLASESQISHSGRWRVEGRVVPARSGDGEGAATDHANREAAPDDCDKSDPDCEMVEPVPADVSGDGRVNSEDLLMLLVAWGACPAAWSDCEPASCEEASCAGDVDGDGSVTPADIAQVIRAWRDGP
jgi:hypothetical protein